MEKFVDEVNMGLDHDDPKNIVEDQKLPEYDDNWSVEEGAADDD